MRQIKYVVFHCTGAPATQKVDVILDYWKRVKGWSKVGYHYLVEADGTIHELAPIFETTNGVAGYNSNAIHICYIGGDNWKDTRTMAQKASLAKLARKFKLMFPDAKFCGHRDFSPDKNKNGKIDPSEYIKFCPAFEVSTWLKEIGLACLLILGISAMMIGCAAKKQVATLQEVTRDSTATTKSKLVVEQYGDEFSGFVPSVAFNKEATIKKDTVFFNSGGLKLWFVPSVINGVDGFNFKAEAKPTARSTLQAETEAKNSVKEAKQETVSNIKEQSFIEQLTEFLKAASWAVGILIIVYLIIKLSGKFKRII